MSIPSYVTMATLQRRVRRLLQRALDSSKLHFRPWEEPEDLDPLQSNLDIYMISFPNYLRQLKPAFRRGKKNKKLGEARLFFAFYKSWKRIWTMR